MSTDDEMTINERRKYLRKMNKHYQESTAKRTQQTARRDAGYNRPTSKKPDPVDKR
jgi:hypothetical protein